MRVVLLGGSGFIGSALAALLAARGDTVVISTRAPERMRSDTPGVQYAGWDGKNPAQLALLLSGADAVVNLLGESIAASRWTPERKRRLVMSRTRAGQAVSDAFGSMESPPPVLIQASAVGYYGSWPDLATAPVCTEDAMPGSNFLAETALKWEETTAALGNLENTRLCVIRTAPVLGRGGMLRPLLPLFKLGLGGVLGSGRQPFPWIQLQDEVAAIAFLLDTPSARGPYNLAAPVAVTMEDFVKTLGKVLSRPTLFPVPAFMLRLVLGEMGDELILSGQNVLPKRLLEAGFRFRYPTLEQALEAI